MEEQTISNEILKKALECMLFVSPQPLSMKHVAKSLNLDENMVDGVMQDLRVDYHDHGLQIIRIAGGYQMCTRPEFSDHISALLKPERSRLSQAALETVAIVAYKQPITQPEIEAIRGVNSDGVLKTLTDRNLIRQAGRRETAGRPILYTVTDEFLNYFGLNDLTELPEIEAVAAMVPTDGKLPTSNELTLKDMQDEQDGNVEIRSTIDHQPSTIQNESEITNVEDVVS